jgi:hypothetical protein
MQFRPLLIFLVLVSVVIFTGCTNFPPSVKSVPLVSQTTPGPSQSAHGTWTFVVFGDSRDITKNTTTGISPYLYPIAVAVANESPDLVIYNGDLVSGWIISESSPVATDYPAQFRNWMTAVSPIHNFTTGSGIPLYMIRGNHEDGPNETVMPLLDAYLASVARDMPLNGPPGEERLTYSFTWKGAKFIGIDEYTPHNGLKETVDQNWVDKELTNDTRPFIFVFGHAPAYPVDSDLDDKGYDLSVRPEQRDLFWNSLADHHVTAYFSGHAHMYVRGVVQGVQQVVSGNGGAVGNPFNPAEADPTLRIEYPLQNVPALEGKVGYFIVTVDERAGTMSAVQKVYDHVNGTWTTGDLFVLLSSGQVIPGKTNQR